MTGQLSLHQSIRKFSSIILIAINAAAPKRDAPAADPLLFLKMALTLTAPPCFGEALRRGKLTTEKDKTGTTI
jgi:hypothetical protein